MTTTALRSISLRATLITLVALSVLLGVSTAFAPKATSASSSSTPSRGPSDKARIRLAHREAAHLLTSAATPPGARALTTWLRIKGYELSAPSANYGASNDVDEVHYFVQSAKAASTSWIDAYVPAGSTRGGTGSGNYGMSSWTFNFAGTVILNTQVLEYTSQALPDGRSSGASTRKWCGRARSRSSPSSLSARSELASS